MLHVPRDPWTIETDPDQNRAPTPSETRTTPAVSQTNPPRTRLPQGVTALPQPRGGRGYRASIRRGKGGHVHLGLYETPWLAAFAYVVAAKVIGREGGRGVDIPLKEQPTADDVVAIAAKVRRRLGIDPKPRRAEEIAPDIDDLLTLFEVTVLGFWQGQAADDAHGHPGAGLDAAAGQLLAAARLLFWQTEHPTPLDVLTKLLGRRLDGAFRRSDVTRDVLDDDGDDPWRVARWLVHPDNPGGGRGRGFREEVRFLYPDLFGENDQDGPLPDWATILGVTPPLSPERVRAAYLRRSRSVHPDVGGSTSDFVRLQVAYEEAKAYISGRMG